MTMSLSALNSPPLVAAAGAAAYLGLPAFEKLIADPDAVSWAAVKGINVLAYVLNYVSVSIPGRLDGENARALADEGDLDRTPTMEEAQALTVANGKTLAVPSGYAFAIWGPIYAGELIFVASSLFLSESSPVASLVREVTAPFVVAQAFQALWCASFRPKYAKSNAVFVSTVMLPGGAFCLSRAHALLVAAPKPYTALQYCTYFLPLSLHFGWLTAASIVNFNGALAMKKSVSARSMALLGHASVVAASALGALVAVQRSAPVFGGVITWALLAISDAMASRLASAEKKEDVSGIVGARMQRKLSILGALVSGGASMFALGSLVLSDSK